MEPVQKPKRASIAIDRIGIPRVPTANSVSTLGKEKRQLTGDQGTTRDRADARSNLDEQREYLNRIDLVLHGDDLLYRSVILIES